MKISLWIVFIFVCCGCRQAQHNSTGKTSIALLPYHGFDTSLVQLASREISEFYHCKTMILPARALPGNAFYPARARYKADTLLAFQKTLVNGSISSLVGFTNYDISTSRAGVNDWGIFGLGFCPGNACVISSYRLQRNNAPAKLFSERLIKVTLHEIGHNLGLAHCTYDPNCLMNDAKGTISQVDRERKWLCEKCTGLLKK